MKAEIKLIDNRQYYIEVKAENVVESLIKIF